MHELVGGLAVVALCAPLLGALIVATTLLRPAQSRERFVAHVARAAFTISVVSAAGVLALVWVQGERTVSLGTWFVVEDHQFELALLLDRLGVTMMALSAAACGLIGRFSASYLHREPGHTRFYFLLAIFAFAMMLVVTAGNLDMLFVGWELVGLSSALLIGFFHERPAPVQNGLRAFATYRICDIGLLVGIILLHHHAHHVMVSNANPGAWSATIGLPAEAATPIAIGLLVGAMGKSAQFPVGGWLPRAMEGPTPSSAIFYGALSIHAGAFLLLRARALLDAAPMAAAAVIGVGALTAVTATLSGRVQADVKNQLAYAAMSQVGLIFVEIGLGFYELAMWHLVGHATLRGFQLLRAPAILHELHTLHGGIGDFETGRFYGLVTRWFPSLERRLYVGALGRAGGEGLGRALARRLLGLAHRAARLEATLTDERDPQDAPVLQEVHSS